LEAVIPYDAVANGWMDGWKDELQLGLSQVSLGFYLYQVFFCFWQFLASSREEKKKPVLQRIFWGKKKWCMYGCHIMKDFYF
jgi:hypothetical protein